jgi:hypothetical protein
MLSFKTSKPSIKASFSIVRGGAIFIEFLSVKINKRPFLRAF